MGMSQSKPKLDPMPNTYMISNLKMFLSHMRHGGKWQSLWDETRLARAISALENARTTINEMEAQIADLESEVAALRKDLQEANVSSIQMAAALERVAHDA